MTPIEIITLIATVLIILRALIFLVRPNSRWGLAKKIIKLPLVSLILAAVVLYFLLVELTIVQVFASVVFAFLLILITVSSYPEIIDQMTSKTVKNKIILKKVWLPALVWAILIIWVLYTFFV